MIEDIFGDFGFRLVWKPGDVSVDIKAFLITGRDMDGAALFEISDNDHITDIANAKPYLDGFLKWDCCCHFYFGERDNAGYIHMCGPESFTKHTALMKHIFEKAPQHIAKVDMSMWK